MTFSAQFVKSLVGRIFPSLRKTQKVNLSLSIFGQIKTQSGLMSVIVREVPGAFKHKHRLKRFWRFISNPRIKPEKMYPLWVKWCINKFNKDRIVKVAIDWTTLPGNIQCLMIAIPFKGRAIPLIWQLVLYRDIKDSQNRIEERLIARLSNILKEVFPDKKLLIIADRGFGRATFIEFLIKKNLLFVIRVKADVIIKTSRGKSWILRNLGKTLKPNIPLWFENITYRSDGKVEGVNLTSVFTPVKNKEDDPWFLVTNLRKAETAIERYRKRFQIEEWFKDLKHQLGISKLQTKNLMRVRRMVLISSVAYAIVMLIGTVADRLKTIKDNLITGGKKAASRIWFALEIIKHKLLGKNFWRKVYIRGTAP